MAYEKNMELAARRHYDDGCSLLNLKRYDNAGYHFGFAAECAVKHKLLESGVSEGDDSIWKHWPTLRSLALLAISGRSADPLRKLLQPASFMQEWDTDMRYAENGSVTLARANKWRDDANDACGLLI